MSTLKVRMEAIRGVVFTAEDEGTLEIPLETLLTREKDFFFRFLHSERGFKNAKRWFSSQCKNLSAVPAAIWGEAEFLDFMRAASNLSDVRILNLFDWIEVDGRVDFDAFFLVLALLFSVDCGQSTQFLYYHGRRFFDVCKKRPSDTTLSYNRFSRLAYAMGMTDDLIFGLLKQHGVTSFPPSIKFDRWQLYYFAIMKNFDKVAQAPDAVRTEWEETYTNTSAAQCVIM